MMMLSAPSGVTRMAGANAYAAKFANSPTITAAQWGRVEMQPQQAEYQGGVREV